MAKKKLIDSNGFLYFWGQIKERFAPKEHNHKYAGSDSAGGAANTAKKLLTAVSIDGMSFDGSAGIAHYAVCDTSADTVEKTVTLTGFALNTGSRIAIRFTHGTKGNSPTLNINGAGAKAMKYGGNALKGVALAAGRVYEFIYDGVSFELVGEIDTDTVGMEEVEFAYGSDQTGITQRPVSMAAYLIDPVDFDDKDPFNTLANVGDANQPVYFENGVPKPANAYSTATLSGMGVTATAAELNKLNGMTATKDELNYVGGVTSSIQTQLNNRYTKGETDSAISKAVAEAGHIKRTIVTTLPAASAAEANVIYMMKDDSIEDDEIDVYNDYMLIDGKLVMVGDTSVDFDVMTNEEISAILAQ